MVSLMQDLICLLTSQPQAYLTVEYSHISLIHKCIGEKLTLAMKCRAVIGCCSLLVEKLNEDAYFDPRKYKFKCQGL